MKKRNSKNTSLSICSLNSRGRNSISYINDLAMKYRDERIKLTKIASLIDPNTGNPNDNLFLKLGSKGLHLDKDIQISQKILFDNKVNHISQGNISFNPFVLNPTPKIINNAEELDKKDDEIAEYYKNKIKRKKEETEKYMEIFSQKNNRFDSINEFENDISDKEVVKNQTKHTSKKDRKLKRLQSLSVIFPKTILKRPIKMKTDIKIESTPIKEKVQILNSNCFKMKMNILNEQQYINDYTSNNEFLSQSSQFINENVKEPYSPLLSPICSSNKKLIKYLNTKKDNFKSINMLLQLSSQDTCTPIDKLKNQLTKKIKLMKCFNTSSQTSKRNISQLMCNSSFDPTSANCFSQSKSKKDLKQIHSKQLLIDIKSIKVVNKIKEINAINFIRFKKERSEKERNDINNKLEKIDQIHKSMFNAFDQFEINFNNKLDRIKNRKRQKYKL